MASPLHSRAIFSLFISRPLCNCHHPASAALQGPRMTSHLLYQGPVWGELSKTADFESPPTFLEPNSSGSVWFLSPLLFLHNWFLKSSCSLFLPLLTKFGFLISDKTAERLVRPIPILPELSKCFNHIKQLYQVLYKKVGGGECHGGYYGMLSPPPSPPSGLRHTFPQLLGALAAEGSLVSQPGPGSGPISWDHLHPVTSFTPHRYGSQKSSPVNSQQANLHLRIIFRN